MSPERGPGDWTPESLVEEYGDFVYNLAVRMTRDREEAKDLAQDAFIHLIRGFGSYRGESSPAAWVSRVVLNCHRNRQRWWRRLRRGRAISLEEPARPGGEGPSLGEMIPDARPDPESSAVSGQVRARVLEALGRLPDEQRAILVLREIEGFSYLEIAQALGVAEGTVKSRISRARQALRTILMERSEEGER